MLSLNNHANKLYHVYLSHSEVVRHFRYSHLRRLAMNAQITYPICIPAVLLLDKMHFQNHSWFVHGLMT